MKGFLALLLGGFGLAAWLQRRRSRPAVEGSPADELRAKLAETRTVEEPAQAPAPGPGDPEARRRSVHERARRELDELA